MKTILLEEAIRALALIAIVLAVAVSVAHALGADTVRVAQFAVLVPLFVFPFVVWARIRTGRAFKLQQVTTRRAWFGKAVIGFVLSAGVLLLNGVGGVVAWHWVAVGIAISALVVGVTAWLGVRLLPLQ